MTVPTSMAPMARTWKLAPTRPSCRSSTVAWRIETATTSNAVRALSDSNCWASRKARPSSVASGVSAMQMLPRVTDTIAATRNRPTPNRPTAGPATTAPTSELRPPTAATRPIDTRPEPELGREHEVDRPEDAPEAGHRRVGHRQWPQDRIAERQAETLPDLRDDRFPLVGRRIRFPDPDTPDEQGRDEERERIERDGDRRRQELDQPAARAEADEFGRRAAGRQRAVGGHEPVPPDDGRQEGAIGDVEERREDGRAERDRDEMGKAEADRERASGMLPRIAARPRSATIMTGRRRSRSTQAPATSPRVSPAMSSADLIAATSAAPAPSTRIAAKGSAVRVTNDPSWEATVAAQSRTKSPSRQRSGSAGIGREHRGGPRAVSVTGDDTGLLPTGFARAVRYTPSASVSPESAHQHEGVFPT